MKKFVLIGLMMNLCGASLCAMNSPRAKELLKLSIKSDLDADNFANYVHSYSIDIDTFVYSKNKTLAAFLNKRSNSTSDNAIKNRINGIFTTVERYRSNPPDVDTLRKYIEQAVKHEKTKELEIFLHDRRFNCDRIAANPTTKTTIRSELNRLHTGCRCCIIDPGPYLALRVIDYSILRNFILDVLGNEIDFEVLEKYYKGLTDFSLPDIDTIQLDPTEKIIANLPFRSIGRELDARCAEPNARRILELVRPRRYKEMAKFKKLFDAYQKDRTKFAELKKWFEEHPFDIDKALTPLGYFPETFGDLANRVNDPALLELFKSTRSDLNWPQKVQKNEAARRAYFWTKILVGSTVVLGAGLYYYWKTKHAQKDEAENTALEPLAVA